MCPKNEHFWSNLTASGHFGLMLISKKRFLNFFHFYLDISWNYFGPFLALKCKILHVLSTSKVENYLENYSFQLEFLTLRGFILINLGFKELVIYLKYAVVQEGLGIVCGLNKLFFLLVHFQL